ncbi:fungal-specific transcription factor domain-containing protein [Aspergillus carlsbadensis]|nr:fungal-specific transcription factor domain-containing protein [Aspergillus carlsbadensis]
MAKALSASPQDSSSDEPGSPGAKQRRTRSRIACDGCHSQHARCDRVFPCSRCLRKNIQCGFSRELRKRGRLPKHISRPGNGIMTGTTGLYNADTSSPGGQFMISPTASDTLTSDGSQQSSCYVDDVPVLLSQGIEYPQSLDELVCPMQRCEKDNVLSDSLLFQDASADFPDLLAGIEIEDGSLPLGPFTPTDFPECSSPRHAGSESQSNGAPPPTLSSLKYPVLQPLLPFIESTISAELACGLLDLYFTSAFPEHMHPVCHHIHCYAVRKASFLDEISPRPSSPALLASMLWVAASDDRAFSLPTSPYYRKQLCHFLHWLTVQLLGPLSHTPSDGPRKTTGDGTPYSDINLANLPGSANSPPENKFSVETIDDVITYIHIASILSASDQKTLSMKWWYAAFTLARELKLNQEVEAMPAMDFQGNCFSQMDSLLHFPVSNRRTLNCVCNGQSANITEEQREERRRVWWLLYIMDRHLALSDNRPLILLDSESKDLLLPLDERSWQVGKIHSNSRNPIGPQCPVSGNKDTRRVFPDFTCHDQSIFGFLLPLMTIIGQVVDLDQMRNHPILGAGALGKETLNTHRNQVLQQLAVYELSLNKFTTKTADVEGASPSNPEHLPTHAFPRSQWMSHTITAYASYYVHVLHILLDERWDSTRLIEDKDISTSSPNFTSAVSCALKAAASVKQILKYDPDVSFMPELFETQLLRGSLYFLLIIERLHEKADEPFLSACEIMIRAMESCIVTLNTEYQRSFCQVMRSAVAQARGRPINHCEIQRRHRAILALYGRTETGAELAL